MNSAAAPATFWVFNSLLVCVIEMVDGCYEVGWSCGRFCSYRVRENSEVAPDIKVGSCCRIYGDRDEWAGLKKNYTNGPCGF